MRKHLNHIEILKYRQATLPPHELLDVDFHLETCAECRFKLRQNQELAALYQSFFEPLDGASEEEKTRLFKDKFKERWRKLRSMDFFSAGTLLTNRLLQAGFAGLVFLIFGSVIFVSLKSAEKSNEIAENQPIITNDKILNPPIVQKEPDTIETANNIGKQDLVVKKAANRESSKPKKDSAIFKTKQDKLVVNVSSLESDQSRSLTKNETSEEEKTAIQIGFRTLKDQLRLKFTATEKADEYEIFVAELPEFRTVVRVKSVNSEYSIPIQKLSRGKDYVLQIT
nr:hypothetical protein [Pyrinomonadaceae bacterium]